MGCAPPPVSAGSCFGRPGSNPVAAVTPLRLVSEYPGTLALLLILVLGLVQDLLAFRIVGGCAWARLEARMVVPTPSGAPWIAALRWIDTWWIVVVPVLVVSGYLAVRFYLRRLRLALADPGRARFRRWAWAPVAGSLIMVQVVSLVILVVIQVMATGLPEPDDAWMASLVGSGAPSGSWIR